MPSYDAAGIHQTSAKLTQKMAGYSQNTQEFTQTQPDDFDDSDQAPGPEVRIAKGPLNPPRHGEHATFTNLPQCLGTLLVGPGLGFPPADPSPRLQPPRLRSESRVRYWIPGVCARLVAVCGGRGASAAPLLFFAKTVVTRKEGSSTYTPLAATDR